MARALRILLVDGEEAILSAVATVLARRGHQVATATCIEDALELETPDVLVTELRLGGCTGFELIESIESRGGRPRAVLLASRPSLEDCRRALHAGVRDLLTKPFRLEELVRAIEAEPLALEVEPRAPLAAKNAAPATTSSAGFEHSYSSTPASVEQAARDVVAHALRCGLSPTTRARIGSVVAELVDNARRHAYFDSRARIQVAAELDRRELVVRVEDEGDGFARSTHPRDPRQSGLARCSALAESFSVESAPGLGTRAIARFAAYRVDFDEDEVVDLGEHDFFTPDLARRVLHSLKKEETASLFRLSPALAVVVGRWLVGAAEPDRQSVASSRGSARS